MNKLNVFKLNFYSWRYPDHWWRNIKMFARAFKMAYQRVTKGFCDWDRYDLDYYYANLIGDSLKEFAHKTNSYPINIKPEEWTEKLDKLGSQFKAYTMDPESAKPFVEKWEKENNSPETEKDIELKLNDLMVESLKELAQIYDDLWD